MNLSRQLWIIFSEEKIRFTLLRLFSENMENLDKEDLIFVLTRYFDILSKDRNQYS